MLNSGSLVAGISFIILVNTSCHSRSVPMRADFRSMIAATDDTVHGYAIMILKSHRFAYTITDGTQQPTVKREFYHGTWQYQTDTLFLVIPGILTTYSGDVDHPLGDLVGLSL